MANYEILEDITLTAGQLTVQVNSSENIGAQFTDNDLLFVDGELPLLVHSITDTEITLHYPPENSIANTSGSLIAGAVPVRDALDIISKNNDAWSLHFGPFINWLTTPNSSATMYDTFGNPRTVTSITGLEQLVGIAPDAADILNELEPRVTAVEQQLDTIEPTIDSKVTQATTAAIDANTAKDGADSAKLDAENAATAANLSSISAANSAAAAATSESNADGYRVSAENAQVAAQVSASAAANSETNAATHASAADSHKLAAANSEAVALTKANEANTSALSASASAAAAQNAADSITDEATQSANNAAAAQASANAAAISETNANVSAVSAASSASNAENSKTLAEAYAVNPVDVPITGLVPNTYSSLHHATKAATSEANASSSELTASTEASNAATFANTATSKATEAATSAQEAADSANAILQLELDFTSTYNDTVEAKEAAVVARDVALGHADNAETSAVNADTAKVAAQTAATTAESHKDAAALSATTASTKAGEAASSAAQANASEVNAADDAGQAELHKNAAYSYSQITQSLKDETEVFRDESEVFRNQAEQAKTDTELLRDTISGGMAMLGSWDASTGNLPPTPSSGSVMYKITVSGTIDAVNYGVGDSIVFDPTNSTWFKIDNTESVTSVAGKQGVVDLNKNDVELDQVDNTSDLNKPISTATQAALDALDVGVSSVEGATGDVTLTDIGLENVDNTADIDKPVSTATQTELDSITTRIDTIEANPAAAGGSYDAISGGGAFKENHWYHLVDDDTYILPSLDTVIDSGTIRIKVTGANPTINVTNPNTINFHGNTYTTITIDTSAVFELTKNGSVWAMVEIVTNESMPYIAEIITAYQSVTGASELPVNTWLYIEDNDTYTLPSLSDFTGRESVRIRVAKNANPNINTDGSDIIKFTNQTYSSITFSGTALIELLRTDTHWELLEFMINPPPEV